MAHCEEAEQAPHARSTDSTEAVRDPGCWAGWGSRAQGAHVCPQVAGAPGPTGGREGCGQRAQGLCLALSPAASEQPSPPSGPPGWRQPERARARHPLPQRPRPPDGAGSGGEGGPWPCGPRPPLCVQRPRGPRPVPPPSAGDAWDWEASEEAGPEAEPDTCAARRQPAPSPSASLAVIRRAWTRPGPPLRAAELRPHLGAAGGGAGGEPMGGAGRRRGGQWALAQGGRCDPGSQ